MDRYEFDFTYDFEGQRWIGHDFCEAKSLNSARKRLRDYLKKQGCEKLRMSFIGISKYDFQNK
jgi:hypothetical protein